MNTQPPYKLGHVHLKVRDLDRAVSFYTRTFGLAISERVGDAYAFLTDGIVHHVVALQAVGALAPDAPPHGVGLYHTAFEVSDKSAFAAAYVALLDAGERAVAVDHGISWALYFSDPDGNGLEIYADTRGDAGDWAGLSRRLTHEEIIRASGADH